MHLGFAGCLFLLCELHEMGAFITIYSDILLLCFYLPLEVFSDDGEGVASPHITDGVTALVRRAQDRV